MIGFNLCVTSEIRLASGVLYVSVEQRVNIVTERYMTGSWPVFLTVMCRVKCTANRTVALSDTSKGFMRL